MLMKSLFIVLMLAAATFTVTGCKKEETPGSKLDSLIESGEKQADKAAKDADKAAGDLQKKLDGALKK